MDALQQLLADASLEASLLASFAADSDLLWQWADRLPLGAFSEGSNRSLYEAQQEAALAGKTLPGLPVPVEMAADPDEVATALLSLYQKRRLADLCAVALRKVRDASDVGELMAALASDIADLEAERGKLLGVPFIAAKEMLPSLWIDLQARAAATQDTGLPGIATGFQHLDYLTNGLEPGLYLLAGPPKSGKTTLANQMAYQVAASGLPVVYVSFENDPLDLLLKQVCRLSGQPLLRAQRGQVDLKALHQAGQRLASAAGDRLYYLAGGAETSLPKVRAKVKQALNRHGAAQGLVVIDYLQKMALVKQSGDMRDCVNRLSLQLRDLARELDSPLLALASLSREGYGPGKRANLAALKESGNLEYDADAVWLLELNEEDKPGGLREVTFVVAAARRSPTGTVKMMLKSSCGQFVEMEDERRIPDLGRY